MEKTNFISFDGFKLVLRYVIPKGRARGVIQLLHGFYTHSARYIEFMEHMANEGYIVYGLDMRGNGETAGIRGLGLADDDIFTTTVEDNLYVTRYLIEKHKLPVILIGHGYGGYVAEACIERGCEATAVILIGAGKLPRLRTAIVRSIFNASFKLLGAENDAEIIMKFIYGKKNLTKADGAELLTGDNQKISEFKEDSMSGYVPTIGYISSFYHGMNGVYKKKAVASIPRDLPMLIMSGGEDAITAYGKEAEKLYNFYIDIGMNDVKYLKYAGAKHDLLNETMRNEIYKDIITFVEHILVKV